MGPPRPFSYPNILELIFHRSGIYDGESFPATHQFCFSWLIASRDLIRTGHMHRAGSISCKVSSIYLDGIVFVLGGHSLVLARVGRLQQFTYHVGAATGHRQRFPSAAAASSFRYQKTYSSPCSVPNFCDRRLSISPSAGSSRLPTWAGGNAGENRNLRAAQSRSPWRLWHYPHDSS